jgi:uncharacterized protein (DUF4415 family)
VRSESATDKPIPYEPGDGPYDPNDPKAVERFAAAAVVRRRGQRGPQKSPTKEKVTLRLSPEVVSYFRQTGPGWQTRLNDTLEKFVKRKGNRRP